MSAPNLTNAEEVKITDRILEIENQLGEIAMTVESLAVWQKIQGNNILGLIREHVRNQLSLGYETLANFDNFVKPEYPSEQMRIDSRRSFHSKLLRRMNRNFFVALFIAMIPVFLGWLDGLSNATPFSGIIYGFIAAVIAILSLILALGLRARKRKLGLKSKHTGRIIGYGWSVAALIASWPYIGFFVKLAVNSSWFPSLWEVILAAALVMIFTFVRAVVSYAYELSDFWYQINAAYEALNARRGGALKIRTTIRRLELTLTQLGEWDRIIGQYIRKPWITRDRVAQATEWEKDATKLPKSIRIANALETSESQSNPVKRTINQIISRESRNGWRVNGLLEFIALAPKFEEVAAKLTWSGIDQDNPLTPNGSLRRLRALAESDEYLTLVGDSKVDRLIPIEQDRILADAQLEVKAVAPSKGQPEVSAWDEHLRHVVGNLGDGEPPFANFAIMPIHTTDGIATKNLVSYVIGPERLISNLKKEFDGRINSNTHLVPAATSENRHIDIVLRMDFAGLAPAEVSANFSPIWPEALVWPGDSVVLNVVEDETSNLVRCAKCGRSDCPAATNPKLVCKESGI